MFFFSADLEDLCFKGDLTLHGEKKDIHGPHMRLLGDWSERPLDAKAIEDGLAGQHVGRKVVVLAQTSSTNDEAWRAAGDGAENGVVVFAEEQIAGRGRLGASWHSAPRRNLLFSVLLSQVVPPARLCACAACSVCLALRRLTSLNFRVKWPNDVVVADRKVAGVLVETRDARCVVGIGVNVNATLEDFPLDLRKTATSVAIETGRFWDRTAFAREILIEFSRLYQSLTDGAACELQGLWRRLLAPLPERVVIEEQGERVTGRVLDVEIDGGLLVMLDRGGLRTFDGATARIVASKLL